MNKIEERLQDEFERYNNGKPVAPMYARIAASIALELAERAWEDGHDNGYVAGLEGPESSFKDFKRDLL